LGGNLHGFLLKFMMVNKMKFSESETIELKKSTANLKNGIISIAAILNKHGKGELYFGIKNDGTVVGHKVSENTIRQISQSIAENIEPKIYPEINHIKIKGIDCIHIKFSGNEKPYYAFGRPFIRVGDEDREKGARQEYQFFAFFAVSQHSTGSRSRRKVAACTAPLTPLR
jgi:ATP-dependent DNA helicase RecG